MLRFFRFALLMLCWGWAGSVVANAQDKHVIYISVDGLRADFLQGFMEKTPDKFPNFIRFRDMAASTFNARCDANYSITLPNHICMITGRPASRRSGLGLTAHHGYVENFPLPGETIHTDGNEAVPYKSSIFDVVHDHGFSTALYLTKERMRILDDSYNGTNGAKDEVGRDNGRDKIDFTVIADYQPVTLTDALVKNISTKLHAYSFVHFADPDKAGHAKSWSNEIDSPYYEALVAVDGYLGTLLDALAANPKLKDKVFVILSADHGGGDGELTSHGDQDRIGNCIIPFFVFGPGFTGGTDAHSCFENRKDPGTTLPAFTDPDQPLRNGDAANLSAMLLGLPPIPGSVLLPKLK